MSPLEAHRNGRPGAARRIVAAAGLYALQHRGQESAGIVSVDGDHVARGSRKMGLVSEGLSAQVLDPRPSPVDKACGEGLMPGARNAISTALGSR